MSCAARQRNQIEVALFLVSILTFAYFYQASDHSTACRFDLIRSILERHSVWIDGYCGYNTADIVNFRGHIYAAKAPGGALTGLLPWVLSTVVLSFVPFSNDAMFWAIVTWFTILMSTSLIVAGGAVVMYRFALWFGASEGRATAMALTMAFATIMFPYATEMTGEPIAGICGLTAFYLLAAAGDKITGRRALLAGMLAGWAVLNDYPAILIAAPLGAYVLVRLKGFEETLSFSTGAAAIALILLAYNKAAFGDPLFLPYQAFRLPENRNFPEQAVGFVGLTHPKLYVLWKILIDPQRGLLFCNPVLLLMMPGLVYLWRRRELRAEFGVIAFVIAGFILFNGSYGESIVSWGGGTATGPRQLAAAVPFMVLALVFIPRNCNYLWAGLAALSAFMMLMATAVEPHLPYEYSNPIGDFVIPAYFRGDLAYNRASYFGGAPVVGDSVAFNFGKLIGLPRAFQLWPLAAIWIAAGWELIRLTSVWRSPFKRRLAGLTAMVGVAALFVPPTVGALMPIVGANAQHGLLGRYYEGLTPNALPPHLERIDPLVDFTSIAQLGALPYPSVTVWTGTISIARGGPYRFIIQADDNGWLKLDGRWVVYDAGTEPRPLAAGEINLTTGRHRIEIGERNLVGEASFHIFWQPPGGPQEVLPSEVLSPDRPPN